MKKLMKYGMIVLLLATLVASVSAVDSITITNPNKFDPPVTWQVGTAHTIYWTYTGGVEPVTINLFYQGTGVLTIATGVPVSDGSYTWTVPLNLQPGTPYYIMIFGQNSGHSDNSGPITITAPPPCTYDLGVSIDPEQQSVAYGGTATWTVTVTNGGTCDLKSVTVSDVNAAVAADAGCSRNVGLLPHGSKSYTCSQANVIAPFKKTVIAKGQDDRGAFYSATDTAAVLLEPCNPAVSIVGTPAAQFVNSGGAASWTIKVTNTGDKALTGVAVSGSVCKKTIGSLAVGATSTFKCSKAGFKRGTSNNIHVYPLTAKGTACGLTPTAKETLWVTVKP
jgi:predicted secreted protein